MDVKEKLVELLTNSPQLDVLDWTSGWEEAANYLIAHGVTVQEWIDRAPTVDATSVVRCKDCIHSSDVLYHTYCGYLDCVVYPHFYCAGGKRKEDK